MPSNCYYCGLQEDEFIKYGKLGCEYCIDYLFRIHSSQADYLGIFQSFFKLPDSNSLVQLESDLNAIESSDLNSHPYSISYRYRISRNRKNSFFLSRKATLLESTSDFLKKYFTNLSYISRERDFEFWMDRGWTSFLQKSPRIDQFRFRLGDEDEVRFELIGNLDFYFQEANWNRLKLLDKSFQDSLVDSEDCRVVALLNFLSSKEIFAYRRGLGYVNSCPSNIGRGDRFSLFIFKKGSFDNKKDIERKIWEDRGYSLSIFRSVDSFGNQGSISGWLLSVKNFSSKRKFYFQHTLVPLIIKCRGLSDKIYS